MEDGEKGREADMSEFGERVGLVPETTEKAGARKTALVKALKSLNDGGADETDGSRPMRAPGTLAQPEQELVPPIEITERYRISTRTLIILLLLFSGAGVSFYFVHKMQKERESAACELLQKGQPLPAAPTEVQLPDVNSLYELVTVCEANHGVDITYGCATEGVLRTAGLMHEPSEIPPDLMVEALRVAQEVNCNW
ncbi:hypothetical protein HZC21_03085 [Candidatus Peregrinibacteria bacterium]|nr:hypothetical protein [Candidatus Peregrinibacteria bacterium]